MGAHELPPRKKIEISGPAHAALAERQKVMQRRAGRQVTFSEVIEDALKLVQAAEEAAERWAP